MVELAENDPESCAMTSSILTESPSYVHVICPDGPFTYTYSAPRGTLRTRNPPRGAFYVYVNRPLVSKTMRQPSGLEPETFGLPDCALDHSATTAMLRDSPACAKG